ncbi:MAG: acyl carrier protein [Burkholderiaceae bacterium]|jgi:acyl carrier protein
MSSPDTDQQSVHRLVMELLARELRLKVEDINANTPLIEMGLDSMSALIVAGEFEDRWNVRLPSTLLWDCPTVEALVAQLTTLLNFPPAQTDDQTA